MRTRYSTRGVPEPSLVAGPQSSASEPRAMADPHSARTGSSSWRISPSNPIHASRPDPLPWGELLRKDDWWAIWIGFRIGGGRHRVCSRTAGSIKWIAVAPAKMDPSHQKPQEQLQNARRAVRGTLRAMGGVPRHGGGGARHQAVPIPAGVPGSLRGRGCDLFFSAFGIKRLTIIWRPPLVALGLGLLVSNTVGAPRWLEPALARRVLYQDRHRAAGRPGLPLTLIAWAGPVAIVQAAIVSLVTFGVIYYSAVRLGPRPAPGRATLGHRRRGVRRIGGHRHRRRRPWAQRRIRCPSRFSPRRRVGPIRDDIGAPRWSRGACTSPPGVAGAVDRHLGVCGRGPGFAARANLWAAMPAMFPASPATPMPRSVAFTLMKVIGRGRPGSGYGPFVLSLIATTRWGSAPGCKGKSDGRRNLAPLFRSSCLVFLAASAVITLLSKGYDYAAYKKDVCAGPRGAAAGASHLGLHLCLSEHRALPRACVNSCRWARRPVSTRSASGVAVNVVLGFVALHPGVQRVLESGSGNECGAPLFLHGLPPFSTGGRSTSRRRSRGCPV